VENANISSLETTFGTNKKPFSTIYPAEPKKEIKFVIQTVTNNLFAGRKQVTITPRELQQFFSTIKLFLAEFYLWHFQHDRVTQIADNFSCWKTYFELQ
jgi:hypothetical protein